MIRVTRKDNSQYVDLNIDHIVDIYINKDGTTTVSLIGDDERYWDVQESLDTIKELINSARELRGYRTAAGAHDYELYLQHNNVER